MSIGRIVAARDLYDLTLAEKAAACYGLSVERRTKEELLAELLPLPPEELFPAAKSTIFFTEKKGPFLTACRCPSGADYRCCGYHTIQSVSGCPYDCSYCILQHLIGNNPFISVFTDRERVEEELRLHLGTHRHLRVGTGELADSLALDDLLDESGFFAAMIARNGWEDRVSFEFKTKSAVTDNLIAAKKRHPACDLVLGLSVNLDRFHTTEECGTAPMSERLAVVGRFRAVGGRVAIHFDPLVMREEFLDEYIALCDRIFTTLDPAGIAWISMGGLRHSLSLTALMRRRWPDSALTLCEMFPAADDHKLRIFAPLRARFYRALAERIRTHLPEPPLYLCMEKEFMWERAGI